MRQNIIHVMQILDEMTLTSEMIKGPVLPIWNNNHACVCWSKNMMTKGLWHVQIQENAVREGIQCRLFKVQFSIEGKLNPSDIFTKEDKDTEHFVKIRNSIMCNFDTQPVEVMVGDQKDKEDINTQSSSQQDTQQNGGCYVGSSPPLTCSTH